MAKENPRKPVEAGERETAGVPNREDAARSSAEGPAQFMKDKRKRTRVAAKNYEPVSRDSRPRTERTPEDANRPRTDRSSENQKYPRRTDGDDGERRSFNPNFSKDNKPLFKESGSASRPRRSYNEDDKWNRVDYDPSGERKTFRKDDRDRKPYGSQNRDEKRYPHSDRPQAYGKRSADERKPLGKRPRTAKPAQRDYGDNYPKFPAPKIEKEMRLNRYIAMSGVSSRREADEYIKSGQVSVNGVVVTELGTKIKPGDEVRFNDKILKGEKKVYIVMNKPKGFVTSVDDPHADKTVMDLLKDAVKERVYPVGRLDKNSLGVLLITNDGDLTTRLTHPSYSKKKIYQVTLDKPLTRTDMDQIAEGITLEDGEIHADEISYVKENKREIGLEIHSGRNRIVRRIFEELGYKVQKLDRVYFAGLTKKNLKRGAWRFLLPREVDMLMSGKYE